MRFRYLARDASCSSTRLHVLQMHCPEGYSQNRKGQGGEEEKRGDGEPRGGCKKSKRHQLSFLDFPENWRVNARKKTKERK